LGRPGKSAQAIALFAILSYRPNHTAKGWILNYLSVLNPIIHWWLLNFRVKEADWLVNLQLVMGVAWI
jgi:hypothetical protein